MAFNEIENLAKRKPDKVPPAGLRVSARSLNVKRGGVDRSMVRFIKINIGADLARRLGMTDARVGLFLAFGSDADAGQIQIAAPSPPGGCFSATRDARGGYALTINAATADGLFALDFPAFTIDRVSVAPSTGTAPTRANFRASPEMLAVED